MRKGHTTSSPMPTSANSSHSSTRDGLLPPLKSLPKHRGAEKAMQLPKA